MVDLSWKRKTKGVTIHNLMNACGFHNDVKAMKNSRYVASYKTKLLQTVNKTVTGWYTNVYQVDMEFTQRGFENWDRIGFEWSIAHKFGQYSNFIEEYDGQGDIKYVSYEIRILMFRRNI